MSTPELARWRHDSRARERFAIAALVLVAAICTLFRLRYGVDFTDEAYYAAFPYRFSLGDAPYLSDLNLHQNAGTLLWPWVSLHSLIVGDSTALILSLRFLYWLVHVGVMGMAILVLKERFGLTAAAGAAPIPVLFVLYGIPALSYNTLTAALFATALLLTVRWSERGHLRDVVLAALAYAAGAYCYPPALPAAVLGWGALLAVSPQSARSLALRALLLTLAGLAVLGAVLLSAWWPGLMRTLELGGSFTGDAPGLRKAGWLVKEFLLDPLTWRMLPLLTLMAIAPRFGRAMSGMAGCLYLVGLVGARAEFVMLWLGLLGLLHCARTAEAKAWPAGLAVSVVSISYGALTAFFSTGGWLAFAVGAVVPSMFAVAWLTSLGAAVQAHRRFTLVPSAFVVILLVWQQWTTVYRDEQVMRLDAVVREGPYKGLRTTPGKRDFIQRVQAALLATDGDLGVVAFNRFPAAYLMVASRPPLPTTWIPDYPTESGELLQQELARSFRAAPRPMLALQILELPGAGKATRSTYSRSGAFYAAFEDSRRTLLLEERDFRLYLVETGEGRSAGGSGSPGNTRSTLLTNLTTSISHSTGAALRKHQLTGAVE